MAGMIKVLVKAPGSAPEAREINNSLKTLQGIVGGYIETFGLDARSTIICNEEGKLRRLPANCAYHGEIFVGTIIIVGVDDEAFTSLTEEQMSFYIEEFGLGNETICIWCNRPAPCG